MIVAPGAIGAVLKSAGLHLIIRRRLRLSHHPGPPRENAPNLRDLIRLMGAMVDRYTKAPAAVTLDIDRHGGCHSRPSAALAVYGERCFLPIHVYDTATRGPVAVLLRFPPVRAALRWAG
jgi:hypothetical protein